MAPLFLFPLLSFQKTCLLPTPHKGIAWQQRQQQQQNTPHDGTIQMEQATSHHGAATIAMDMVASQLLP